MSQGDQSNIEPPTEIYPPSNSEIKESSRSYKDEAAAEMFIAAGGRQLQKSASAMARALTAQAMKLEQFHSTPFSDNNLSTMKITMEALERAQRALEEWHWMIYPNQRAETR